MSETDFGIELFDGQKTVALLVASRAALRVLHIVDGIEENEPNAKLISLLTARAILTASVAAVLPGPEITAAALSAAGSASKIAPDLIAKEAVRAAAYASYAANYSTTNTISDTKKFISYAINAASHYATNNLFEIALEETEGGLDSLLSAPARPDATGLSWSPGNFITRNDLFDDETEWVFWRKWYRGFLKGFHVDWDLQRRVVLIEEEIWEAGPAAVAAEIARIEAEFRTAVSVPLVRNEADTAFVLDDEPPLDDELLDYIKERVGGALRTALDGISDNIFNKDSSEALAISEALRSSNPSAVAGHLNDASLFFQKNFGDLYPADEGVLIALQEAAFSGAEEICETNELARKRCLKASRLFQRKHPKPIDAQEMKEFTSEIAGEAEGEAKAIIQRIGQAIAAGKRVGRFARARFANYSSTIVSWLDKVKKGEARISWLWKKVRELMDVFEPPSEG